jgi:hypothetical protein
LGETARDPEGPDGEKPFPVPLQAVALALVQASVDDAPRGIEVGDADNAAVGAAALAWALSCAPTCPEISSGIASRPIRILVNTGRRNMRGYS